MLAIEDADDQIILHYGIVWPGTMYPRHPVGRWAESSGPWHRRPRWPANSISRRSSINSIWTQPTDAARHERQDWHEPATSGVHALAELQNAESRLLNEMMQAKDGFEGDPEQAMKVWERMKESGVNVRQTLRREARLRRNRSQGRSRACLTMRWARFNRCVRENVCPMIYNDPGTWETSSSRDVTG